MPSEFVLMDEFKKLVCRKAGNAEFIQTKEEEKHGGKKTLDVVFLSNIRTILKHNYPSMAERTG